LLRLTDRRAISKEHILGQEVLRRFDARVRRQRRLETADQERPALFACSTPTSPPVTLTRSSRETELLA